MDLRTVIAILVVAILAYAIGILHGQAWRKRLADRMIERELNKALATVVDFGPDPISKAARLEQDLTELHRYFMGKALLHHARKENDSAAGAGEMARRVHGSWVIANALMRDLDRGGRERCSSSSTE